MALFHLVQPILTDQSRDKYLMHWKPERMYTGQVQIGGLNRDWTPRKNASLEP